MRFYNREKELASLEKVRASIFFCTFPNDRTYRSAAYRQNQSYIQELREYPYGVPVCQPKQ